MDNVKEEKVKKLGPKITQLQKKVLLDLIKDYAGTGPMVCQDSGRYAKTMVEKKKWIEFAEILNSQPNGVKKEWAVWRQTWHDIRLKMRKKWASIKEDQRDVPRDDEEEFIQEHFYNVNFGDRTAKQNEFSEYDSSTQNANPKPFSKSENHSVSSTMPNFIEFKNNKHLTKRKISLTDTVKEHLDRKAKVKEDYYTKKLRLLERDVEAKEKIASSLRLIAEGRSDLF